ncbi:hypothetical protein DRO26_02400 [Candidatus Bathyarchaeota archaeon]|nr:MAG: hypothetical protein DRO26_02400 [Candidatus Bathyarchaeota archaeon]
MRLVWGYLLGHLCKLKTSTIRWLRTYPINNGAAHKQLTLKVTGLAQTLKPFSEGGIDASNLPHNFVSLPIMNLQEKTDCLRKKLENDLNIKLTLMVVDSDRLYISKNKKIPLKLSTRKTCCKTVLSLGFLAYLVGRIFRKRFKPTATPLAISGRNFSDEEVLTIAEIADRVRGYGSGRTVFEMAEYFKAPVDRVTWEMLEKIRHYPVVVVRTQN